MYLKTIFNLFKETYAGWEEHKVSRLAAALAYYTIFSLAPLLILVIAIAGMVIGGDVARSQLVDQLQQLVGTDGAAVIDTVITVASKPNQSTSIIASIIGVLVLIFGAVGVFVQLQDALNTIWEVAPRPERNIRTFIFHRFLSFGIVLGIAFLLLVSLAISAALAFLNEFIGNLAPEMGFLLSIINIVVSFSVITLLFTLIFKYLPDVKIAWSDVIIGAMITALLFTIGKYLIGLYLGRSTFSSAYGAAGSLVVLLVWIYYSAQIIFFGAEFTQVYARHFGSRIRPVDYAVFVTEDARAQQGIISKDIFEKEKKPPKPSQKDPQLG
ncbi:MAG: YihY/virulence factor BrkB family protein [Pseudomonadota bacterium]